MRGRGNTIRTLGATALTIALVLGAGACSDDGGDDAEPESDRPCAVVASSFIGDTVDADVELEKAQEGSDGCVYAVPVDDDLEPGEQPDAAPEVEVHVTRPVEADSLALALEAPERVADLGDEAWASTTGGPQALRLVAREGGTQVTVDLSIPDASNEELLDAARAIAAEGLANAPSSKPLEPTGPRGEEACAPFETEAVADLLGEQPEVSPVLPAGSCLITVPSRGFDIKVSVLSEQADRAMLDAIAASAPSKETMDVGGRPAYWVSTPDRPDLGGQLDLLDGDVLRQVAVLGTEFEPGEAKELAMVLAAAAYNA